MLKTFQIDTKPASLKRWSKTLALLNLFLVFKTKKKRRTSIKMYDKNSHEIIVFYNAK